MCELGWGGRWGGEPYWHLVLNKMTRLHQTHSPQWPLSTTLTTARVSIHHCHSQYSPAHLLTFIFLTKILKPSWALTQGQLAWGQWPCSIWWRGWDCLKARQRHWGKALSPISRLVSLCYLFLFFVVFVLWSVVLCWAVFYQQRGTLVQPLSCDVFCLHNVIMACFTNYFVLSVCSDVHIKRTPRQTDVKWCYIKILLKVMVSYPETSRSL